MIKPMTIKELKKELKKLEQSELIELISGLYKTNDNVKEIVNVKFIDQLNSKGTEDLYLKFKERIESLITSSSGIGWGYGDFIYDKSFELNWIQEEI